MTTSPESRAPESAPERKPCPFCGGAAKERYHNHSMTHFIECGDWRCPGKTSSDSLAVVIAAWNTRAPQAQKEEPQWLPIESAPKDGKSFIGAYDSNVSECYYDWRIQGFRDSRTQEIVILSHFQPLPTPLKP